LSSNIFTEIQQKTAPEREMTGRGRPSGAIFGGNGFGTIDLFGNHANKVGEIPSKVLQILQISFRNPQNLRVLSGSCSETEVSEQLYSIFPPDLL
jgi:hypothetical protein